MKNAKDDIVWQEKIYIFASTRWFTKSQYSVQGVLTNKSEESGQVQDKRSGWPKQLAMNNTWKCLSRSHCYETARKGWGMPNYKTIHGTANPSLTFFLYKPSSVCMEKVRREFQRVYSHLYRTVEALSSFRAAFQPMVLGILSQLNHEHRKVWSDFDPPCDAL